MTARVLSSLILSTPCPACRNRFSRAESGHSPESVPGAVPEEDDRPTWAKISSDLPGIMPNRIINEVKCVNPVVFEISSKPPSAIGGSVQGYAVCCPSEHPTMLRNK